MSPSQVAYMRLEVSDQFIEYGRPDSLSMFRIARERAVRQIAGLVPGSRPLFFVSKTWRKTHSIEVIDSVDRPKAVAILRRLQHSRKEWHGYRTMEDFIDAIAGGQPL